MLKQAFGKEVVSRTQTHQWYQRLEEDQTATEDRERLGPTI
jgi:hypothetical protein